MGGKIYGTIQLVLHHRDPQQHVIPIQICWDTDGNPIIVDPLTEIYSLISNSFFGIQGNNFSSPQYGQWLSPFYANKFPTNQVLARMTDHIQSNIIRSLRANILSIGMPAASTLIRIEPFPQHLSPPARSLAEQEFNCRLAATEKIKTLWPDTVDVAACSQNKPLRTASLAVNGRSTLVTSTPFNGRYCPERRSGIVRSNQFYFPLLKDRWRVHVKDTYSPYEVGTVRLLTLFGQTPFNSLDSQALSPLGAAKLASLRVETQRVVNPLHVLREKGEEFIHRTEAVCFDHEGVKRELPIPEKAYPVGHPEMVGCAKITRVTWSTTNHGLLEAPVVEFEYEFVHPIWTGDKLTTPHSHKGVANVVDFEAEAFLKGEWRPIEVISDGGQNNLSDPNRNPKGLEKRGTAVALHGRLELACELENERCFVPQNVLWENLGAYLPPKLKRQLRAGTGVLTGNVPVRIRIDGEWKTFTCEVGLVPFMRTHNSSDITVKTTEASVPVHGISFASCLRRYKVRHPQEDTLIDWFIDTDLKTALSVMDVLSTPCSTQPLKDRHTLVMEGEGKVYYHGHYYTPIILTDHVQLLGNMSMEVLRPEEHDPPRKDYENTILDPRCKEHGALLILRYKTRLHALGTSPGKTVKHIFFPPSFCKEYFRIRTTQPVSKRPIIEAAAHWANAWAEVQYRKNDPGGNRIQRIPPRFFQLLIDDMANRRGLISRTLHQRKPGIMYVNMALDCCPPGTMWMSDHMRNKLAEVSGWDVPWESFVVDSRFPIEPGTGLQGYILKRMPEWLHADVVTNSWTSEDLQDGDNDGDQKYCCAPPPEYAEEISQMRDVDPGWYPGEPFTPSTFAIKPYPTGALYQLEEAAATGSIKSEIGVISSLMYTHFISEDWTDLNDEEIYDMMDFWSAVLHAAVKKNLDDRLTWPLMEAFDQLDKDRCNAIEESLRELYCHKDQAERDAYIRGFWRVVQFYQNHHPRTLRDELFSMSTIHAPSTGASEQFLVHLHKHDPEDLLQQLRKELFYGAKKITQEDKS